MNYPNIEKFFKEHLRYKQHWNKKVITMHDAEWQPLTDDTYLFGYEFKKDSLFKIFETNNFGWIVFHPTALLVNGSVPIRRIFKY